MGKFLEKSKLTKIVKIISLSVLLVMPIYGQETDWFLKLQKIKVFQSSKQDVERVFDYPEVIYSSSKDSKDKGWGEIVRYKTSSGNLELFYSTGKCSKLSNKTGWDVKSGSVVIIQFAPNQPVELSKLNIDLTTFIREKESDTQYFHYRSYKLGLEFTTLDDKVTSIEYSLTNSMRKLDCKKVLKVGVKS